MIVLDVRNVSEAYRRGMTLLKMAGNPQKSRAGDVLVLNSPVTTVYKNPEERVLFAHGRGANPIFHLMESVWMLSGSNDARWLDQFIGDFSERFAEDGTQWGAYGHRWRRYFGTDQLAYAVEALRTDPMDRRVVIQMWDVRGDLGTVGKDVPCNIAVTPRIVNGALDIGVFCRSNDIIWGAYGANAVHFSVLQEYLAAAIGVPMGLYRQISMNYHAYADVFKAKWDAMSIDAVMHSEEPWDDPYAMGQVRAMRLIEEPNALPWECEEFVSMAHLRDGGFPWKNALLCVAEQMWMVNHMRTSGRAAAAMEQALKIGALDWREGVCRWLGGSRRRSTAA